MKKVIFFGALLVLSLALVENSFAGWKETEISRVVPLPPKINIIRPPSDLPKEIAAFSGRWEGVWHEGIWDGVRSILIVEKINSTEAEGILGWEQFGRVKADYKRWKSKISTGPSTRIEFVEVSAVGTDKHTFEMGEDLKTIHGVREFQGKSLSGKGKVTMKKVEED
jgi:hypothetical protein